MSRRMSHLNMDTYDQTPIDGLAAEAYGPLINNTSVQSTLANWFVASLLLEEAALVNDDGTVKTTTLTPDELVTRPVEHAAVVKKIIETLCNFDASVDALVAAAASRQGDSATRIREAAIPKDTMSNHRAGIHPVHPAIVKAALSRV
jgi:hypothetical protein